MSLISSNNGLKREKQWCFYYRLSITFCPECLRISLTVKLHIHLYLGHFCVLKMSTHLVTVEILTPNTPIGFREGILFRLNSRLVNFMESLTSIWHRKKGLKVITDLQSEKPAQKPEIHLLQLFMILRKSSHVKTRCSLHREIKC